MSTRNQYEKMFAAYPDVVQMEHFRVMLGGITEAAALKLLEQGQIKFFFIHRRHLIPKACVIDYLLGINHISKEVPLAEQKPGKRRRPGTGCLYQINDHLWEGKYLTETEQRNLLETISYEDATPSLAQAIKMKEFSQAGKLNADVILSIMCEQKPNQKEKYVLKAEKLKPYLPQNITPQQTEDYILKALEYYHRYRQRQKEQNR